MGRGVDGLLLRQAMSRSDGASGAQPGGAGVGARPSDNTILF